jgi:PIN domain nuclease of toxin-antitoxin system
MTLLIDTHALLWYLLAPEKLSPPALARMKEPHQQVNVSVASVWEAAIKVGIGKLEVPSDLTEGIRLVGFQYQDIEPEDAWAAGRLPLHHRDPFDRMIIAQALRRNLPVLTRDPRFEAYGVTILPA